MKRRSLIALVVCAMFAGGLYAAEEISLKDAKCPVAGNKPAKAGTEVDYKGGKVFFCCADCVSKFKDKETQAKYEVKANEQLVATMQAKQKGCPLSGRKIDPGTKIEVDGIAVCFCCAGCQGKVKNATAEKQREMIFGKGFDKAFAVAKKDKEKSEQN